MDFSAPPTQCAPSPGPLTCPLDGWGPGRMARAGGNALQPQGYRMGPSMSPLSHPSVSVDRLFGDVVYFISFSLLITFLMSVYHPSNTSLSWRHSFPAEKPTYKQTNTSHCQTQSPPSSHMWTLKGASPVGDVHLKTLAN